MRENKAITCFCCWCSTSRFGLFSLILEMKDSWRVPKFAKRWGVFICLLHDTRLENWRFVLYHAENVELPRIDKKRVYKRPRNSNNDYIKLVLSKTHNMQGKANPKNPVLKQIAWRSLLLTGAGRLRVCCYNIVLHAHDLLENYPFCFHFSFYWYNIVNNLYRDMVKYLRF